MPELEGEAEGTKKEKTFESPSLSGRACFPLLSRGKKSVTLGPSWELNPGPLPSDLVKP